MKEKLIIPFKLFIILLLAILQLQVSNVYGQQKSGYESLRKDLDFMFDRIDKKSVPTGLLRDYAVEEEDFDLYTGRETLTDKNKISIVNYASLLSSIQSAALTTDPIKDFERTLKQWNKSKSNETVRLSIMSFKYAEIKADALTSGLIRYTNGQVENVASAKSPYQIGQVFAACCLDYVTNNQEVIFLLPKEYLLTNTNCTNYELNYGNGFIRLLPNEPIKARLKEGINDIIIKAQSENGEVLITHTFIQVESLEKIATRALDKRADLTFPVTGKSYNGVQTSAQISVKYGLGNSSIKKPFIFVEGFDPVVLDPTNNGVWNFKSFYENYEYEIDNLLSRGYDVVYVDFNKSEEYIQANANVLIEVINNINSKKGTSSQPNVIMAHSMGGLITRYALKKMENENIKHQVGTFVSYDAPHLGAHIPLGVLYGFHAVMKFINDHNLLKSITESLANVPITKYIKYGESIAYSTAAQQMLVYYVDPAGNFNNNHHIAWQKELNTLGFPKGDSGTSFNMWAISNGNYSNTSVHTPPATYLATSFNAESDILNLLPVLSSTILGLALNDVVVALLNVLPGRASIDGHFNIYPAKAANQRVTSISMKYKKKFLWLIPITKNLFSYDRNFPGGYLFDTYPSSPYSHKLDFAPISGGLPVVGQFSLDVAIHPRIPFVPVSSALAYGDGLNSSSTYFTTTPSAGATPFGENYLTQDASDHSKLTAKAFDWVISRLGISVVGANVGNNGTQYTLSNVTGNIAWSTSNSNVATINQQGVLSVKGKGIISVIATHNNIKYSKLVLVGIPRFVLSASHEPGGYRVNASCIDPEYSNRLSELNDAVTYRWGVKFTNKDIQWLESKSHNILIQLEEGSQEVTVFLEVADKTGNTTTTQSVKVTSRNIYAASDQKLYITADGSLYNEKFHIYFYDLSRIYVEYVPGLPDAYKQPKWMIISAKVVSPFASIRNVPFSESGPAINDVIPQREFDYIKNGSENNQTYTYMLILYNAEGLAVQYFPIVFTYRDRI